MKRLLLFIAFILLFQFSNAQIITTIPESPTDSEEITIIFDATGTELEAYTGDVYAFTGVTVNGLNWQNVIGGWAENVNNPLLTRDSSNPNVYTLLITPSVFDYYGVSLLDNITELAFVFRSSDTTIPAAILRTNPDIFIPIIPTNPPPVILDNWGIVGSATPNGWGGPDLPLSYDEVTNNWSSTVTLTDGEFKFRKDNNWSVNYGDNEPDGNLDQNGNNIFVSAGDYLVIANFDTKEYSISTLVSIPDSNFEQALIGQGSDSDQTVNGYILRSDAEATAFINISNRGVNSLIGIESFINLEVIEGDGNNIESVDISNNTKLTQFHLNANNLTSIDFSNNLLLEQVGLGSNNLSALKLNVQQNLTTLDCSNNANLSYLDIKNGNNINLHYFQTYSTNLSCIMADPNISQEMTETGFVFNEICDEFVFIPDSNFEQSLIDLGIDTDGIVNHIILRSDALAVTDLQLTNSQDPYGNPLIPSTTGKIANLTGIEAFVNLTKLGLGFSDITMVDLTFNKELDDLFLADNQLTAIDISKNIKLTRFGVMRNPIAETVDVSQNTLLEELFLNETNINMLDLSANVNLWKLYTNNTNLIVLDVSINLNLKRLDAQYNSGLNVTFPVVEFQSLTSLNLSGTGIASFDATLLPNLEWLLLNDNELTFCDFSKIPNIRNLYIQRNQLTSLDVSKNVALIKLECEGNQLTALDVTNNLALRVLGFGPNNLTEIDVSKNLALEAIWCNGNNLSTLNLDANSALKVIGLSDNPLTYVSLKNGNNVNVEYFVADNTPSLGCINSDAIVPESMTRSGKAFSDDCSALLTGKWIIVPEAGALKVGPEPGSDEWWGLNKFGDDISVRGCYLDDVYEFNGDGSFKNILGSETFLEPFQGAPSEQCGTPVAPHDGSVAVSFDYDQFASTITLNGQGAYLGLPKNVNGSTLSDPNAAPESITYDVSFSENGNAMTIVIESDPGVFWTYKFLKEAVFIPDANFEQALIDLEIDTDGIVNHIILRSDALAVTDLQLTNSQDPYGNPLIPSTTGKIANLTGIEAFVNLTKLGLGFSDITMVDLTFNKELDDLFLADNQLTAIDISKNIKLTRFGVMRNPIAETVDVSQNTLLEELFLNETNINMLDLSANVNLWKLYINNTNLTVLDVSTNLNLKRLDAQYNSGLNVTFPATELLSLTSLNLSGTGIASFDATLLPNLEWLLLNDNALTIFDSSKIPNIQNLFIQRNQLETLDLSKNVALIKLECESNLFSGLDVTKNTSLKVLGCANNNLSSLDVSQNLLLEAIWCTDNNISTLNLKLNTALNVYGLSNNPLVYVSIKNGNNDNMRYIEAQNLLTLGCITVDDETATYLNASNWDVDDAISFGNDCGGFVDIPDPNFEQALIDLGIDTDGVVNTSILRSDVENTLEINANFPIIQDADGNDIPNGFADERLTITEKIADLTGIEAFINLKNLGVGYNLLTEIDLSNNVLLDGLFLNDNLLTSINISNNTLLTRFGVMRNPNIGEVDVSKNTLLKELFLENTGISTIDLLTNIDLWRLHAQNNSLTGLVVSSNTRLTDVRVNNNALTALDVSTNLSLQRLDSHYNSGLNVTFPAVEFLSLTSLNLSGTGLDRFNATLFPNLEWLLLNDNALSTFNASKVQNIQHLRLNNNLLGSLDVSGNGMLVDLQVMNNELVDLNIANGLNSSLGVFKATSNLLTCITADSDDPLVVPYPNWEVDLGVQFSLNCKGEPEVVLVPDSNFELALAAFDTNGLNGNILLSEALLITALDLSGLSISDLTGIEAFENLVDLNISGIGYSGTLDLNMNANLETLNCANNSIDNLFIIGCKGLLQLNAEANNLSVVDLSANVRLTSINVAHNGDRKSVV